MINEDDFLQNNIILEIPSDIEYWLIRANGGKYYSDFLYNDYIAIADNKITLDMIKFEEQKNSLTGITLDNYKRIYSNIYKNRSPQSIAHAASRTMQFINDIKVGDLILVPSYRSTEFLLGVVTSDVYTEKNENPTWRYGEQYPISNYHKKRNVKWIKTIKRTSISDKMYWILSAHQSIFNLTEHSNHIDKLLSPIYVKGNKCYGTLNINVERDINLNEWHELYDVAQKISGDDSSEIMIKTNVQSPGWLEFVSDVDNLPTVLASVGFLSGLLFTKIQLGKMEVLGLIPYFFNEGRIKRESMEIDNEIKKVDLDIKKEELKLMRMQNELKTNIPEELKISPFKVGSLISDEKRKDNDDLLNEVIPEKNKKTE